MVQKFETGKTYLFTLPDNTEVTVKYLGRVAFELFEICKINQNEVKGTLRPSEANIFAWKIQELK